MAKECYSVGYLSEEGYHFMLNDIANRAFYTFDSWEDYALSYVCGGTYYLYCKSGGNEEFAKKTCVKHLWVAYVNFIKKMVYGQKVHGQKVNVIFDF